MSLFDTGRLGLLTSPNRIIMAPLGRARADPLSREPLPRAQTYYTQRASAGLIVSEATHVSPHSVSRPGGAAIHTTGQSLAWRRVTDAVHGAGGRIFQQLFHLGRKADPGRLAGGALPVAPSAIAARGEVATPGGMRPFPVPRVLARDEIAGLVDEFRHAGVLSDGAGLTTRRMLRVFMSAATRVISTIRFCRSRRRRWPEGGPTRRPSSSRGLVGAPRVAVD